ncbi:MAG: NlpC/P60 family protein [Corynebacterium sp.]|nr:NlpC/P60 family protein [Corynebacterium sp.]
MTTLVSASVLTCTLIPAVFNTAQADDVDALIAQMDELSHQAGIKTEEVKAVEDSISESESHIAELSAKVSTATFAADQAQADTENYQPQIDKVANARYRGTGFDPMVNVMAAGNPQDAIDRVAFMSAISRDTTSNLDSLREAVRDEVNGRNAASQALVEAELERTNLQTQLAALDEQRAALEAQTSELREQIDNLTAEAREAWENKNNPVVAAVDFISNSSLGAAAANAALTKQGAPYSWGAAGPDAFDCSGLVYWAFQQQGISLPRTSQAMMAGGQAVSMSDLQPGDVIGYYDGASHVGLYIGNGQLVHASDYGIPVQVVAYDSMPIYGARRYA